jgi:hypothetical protein
MRVHVARVSGGTDAQRLRTEASVFQSHPVFQSVFQSRVPV